MDTKKSERDITQGISMKFRQQWDYQSIEQHINNEKYRRRKCLKIPI